MSTPQTEERLTSSGAQNLTVQDKGISLSAPRSISPKDSSTSGNLSESSDYDYTRVQNTDPHLLTCIKGFSIDKNLYRHYGNRSSMNTESINKIIEDKASAKNKTTNTKKSSSKETSKKQNEVENDKLLLNIISTTLKLDKKSASYLIDHVSNETLNSILECNVAKEVTKQELLRRDNLIAANELLKLAIDSKVDANLVPLLLLKPLEIEELRDRIAKVQSIETDDVTNKPFLNNLKHADEAKNRMVSDNGSPSFEGDSRLKRRHSESKLLPSFSESYQKPQMDISGISTSRRSISLQNCPSSNESDRSSNGRLSPAVLQHSPPTHVTATMQGFKPLYQTPHTDFASQRKFAEGTNTSSPTGQGNLPTLGSPYSQSYNPFLYAQGQNFQSAPPGFALQHPQYSYYISSSPQNAGIPYLMHPGGPHPGMVVPIVQTTNSQNIEESKAQDKREEETSSHQPNTKKQKHSSNKSHGINFMITTPKNPPAKKYNKDKSG